MKHSMMTVKIEVCSWISASLGRPQSGHHIIHNEIKAGEVLSDLFNSLAEAYPEFRQQVYNPDGGYISEQIMVTLNKEIVQESEFAQTVLNDKDEISLTPILVGG